MGLPGPACLAALAGGLCRMMMQVRYQAWEHSVAAVLPLCQLTLTLEGTLRRWHAQLDSIGALLALRRSFALVHERGGRPMTDHTCTLHGLIRPGNPF